MALGIVSQVAIAYIVTELSFADTFGVQTFKTGAFVGAGITSCLMLATALIGGRRLMVSPAGIGVALAAIFCVGSVATVLVTMVRAAVVFFFYFEP